ncbi:MAG: LysR family transcriptional regulator [Gammaproteobacteria bacterium]|nr:LysR family transcriptional regulator [Gammaproteobacteria bacterium]
MDRFEEMQTFVRVVRAGSLSAAADRLNVAKSAVSRRLSDLESRLGVQLLTRTTRRLNLTESGRQYYEQCQTLLAELEEAELALTQGDVALSGTLRIAAPLSFGISHLSPVLNAFLQQHPELKVELDLNDRTLNFMEEEVDLAIRIGHLKDSTLVARKLASSRMILCASPGYLAEHGEPQHPNELEDHNHLTYSYAKSHYWHFTDEQNSDIPVRVNERMRANNGDVLLRGAIDGLGIIMTPDFIGNDAIQQGRLVPILTQYELNTGDIYAIYPKQRFLPKRLRVLVDYLVEQFRDTAL